MSLDLSEYMGAYVDGCKENLDIMDKMLLNLEQNPSNLDAIEEIFRAAHTLKGMSATMGFEKIAHLTHEMENVLDKLRNRYISVTTEVIDVIFETFDILRTLVNDSIEQKDSDVDLTEISAKLNAIGNNQSVASSSSSSSSSMAVGTSLTSVSDGINVSEFSLTDFEKSGLESARDEGKKIILLKVTLVSDCLLKGPRVFMILRTLDDYRCDIVKSIPEVKDLENEKFDTSFKMLLISDNSIEAIKNGIESISEIEAVEVIDISTSLGSLDSIEASSSPPMNEAESLYKESESVSTAAPVEVAPPSVVRPVAAPSPAVSIPAEVQTKEEGIERAIAEEEEEEKAKEIVEMVQLVTFRMANETYALEIQQVEAIINMVPITRVPKAPVYIDGVINLRGEIVPVINTRRRLQLSSQSSLQNNQIIILSFEKEKVKAGFMVDSVAEVITLPETAIEPPNRVSEGVDIEYLKGVGKQDNKLIILLNAHRIVFGKNPEEKA